MATLQLVSQGAEGRLFETTFLGKPCLMKERFKKAYRHPLLDEKLTNKRLTQEVILARLHFSYFIQYCYYYYKYISFRPVFPAVTI